LEKNWDVIVIGGGPAGLMAAGQAANSGKHVLLLEKMNRPGRKLSITGKGRCNITNSAPLPEFISKIQPNRHFLQSTFAQFFFEELVEFMHQIGVKTVHERGGRIFPESGKAVEVTKKLVDWCEKTGVSIVSNSRIKQLIVENGTIKAVRADIEKKSQVLFASKVILASGGASYPATGSTGDGYKLAKDIGHTIEPIYPQLVPLISKEKISPSLVGLELKNCEITLWINNKKKESFFGEFTFMEFGISGPIILSLSRLAIPELLKSNKVEITIDFKPALDNKKLDNRLTREFNSDGKANLKSILKKLMPVKLIDTCLDSTGLSPDILGSQATSKDKKKLRNWLKEYKLTIVGNRPFEEAIITAGGISTKEINQKTMESKIIKGLYFAGEIIDLDGPTGGYNLQIAFSTGWVAGRS
jgi:predicted Rossmann fold flavoprotein